MSSTGVERKPPWSKVPRELREQTARLLGAGVVRATRAFGGYAPSATFRLVLADGRRAFFKGVYPAEGTGVVWRLDEEERVYRGIGDRLRPWAPAFIGSVRADGWHGILLEDLGPADVPPWTPAKTRAAALDYAAFHARNAGARLPRWMPKEEWREFGRLWEQVVDSNGIDRVVALAGRRAREASEWLDVALPLLRAAAARLVVARGRRTLLHLDTRSDNVRVTRGRLRMFDWNFAQPGLAEFDVAAFGQSIASEGGPAPERFVALYRLAGELDGTLVTCSVAAIAGYFVDRAWRPPVVGLPRLRSVQRRQMKATLAWAARLLDLPEPRWLAAVAD